MSIVTSKAGPVGGTNTIRRLKEESAWMILERPCKVPVLHLVK